MRSACQGGGFPGHKGSVCTLLHSCQPVEPDATGAGLCELKPPRSRQERGGAEATGPGQNRAAETRSERAHVHGPARPVLSTFQFGF